MIDKLRLRYKLLFLFALLLLPILACGGEETPTSTPTATPSPTRFAVSLPQTVTTESGHIFTINKIEALANIGDEQPDNGVFLVLLGILQATDESSGCAKSEHFSLTSGFDNSTTYEIDTVDLDTAKRRYGYDYPGGFLGQCPDSTGEDSFIVFDIENSARNIWLRTAKSDVAIGDTSLIVESKTIEITPTPTLPPTATPTPDAYYTVSISEISIFDEPNLEANKIGEVEQGRDLWVIASSQDSMWGKIISQDGVEGWISMDSLDDESSEFDSIPTVTNTPTTTPTPSLAEVDHTLGRGLRLRQYPEGPIIGTMREGDPLIVLYGIEIVDGLVWIEVMDKDGRIGWVPQMFTTIVTITPTPSITPSQTPRP